MSKNLIYHFVEKGYFKKFKENEFYIPVEFEADGFIHCTKEPENVVKVADFIIGKKPGEFLLLVIDEDKVKAEIKYERSCTETLFPHIYGHLNMDAVVEAVEFPRDDEGCFIFPV